MSDGIARRGLLLVLSSPSGGGKTSIGRALRVTDPNLGLSVALTTRPPRAGEVDGKDYHFVDDAAFDAAVREAIEMILKTQNRWDDLLQKYHLTAQDIASAAREVVAAK